MHVLPVERLIARLTFGDFSHRERRRTLCFLIQSFFHPESFRGCDSAKARVRLAFPYDVSGCSGACVKRLNVAHLPQAALQQSGLTGAVAPDG